MRRVFLGGNWKMNKTLAEARDFFQVLKPLVQSVTDLDIFVYPPFTLIPTCISLSEESPVKIGGQNMHYKDLGAFTGAVSGPMLKDIGCHGAIVGHSERRHVFFEPDEVMAPKVAAGLSNDLVTVYCVGETLSEREAKKTDEVIRRQLMTGLDGLAAHQLKNLVIAYEPVWAIGTGKNASQEDAQSACSFIRDYFEQKFGDGEAETIRILYGGSVSEKNFGDYISCPDVDGALIGGASLKPESFAEIINFDRKLAQ